MKDQKERSPVKQNHPWNRLRLSRALKKRGRPKGKDKSLFKPFHERSKKRKMSGKRASQTKKRPRHTVNRMNIHKYLFIIYSYRLYLDEWIRWIPRWKHFGGRRRDDEYGYGCGHRLRCGQFPQHPCYFAFRNGTTAVNCQRSDIFTSREWITSSINGQDIDRRRRFSCQGR